MFRLPLIRGCAAVLLISLAGLRAQDGPVPARPKLTGLSHVGLWVKDIAQSRAFYHDFLGFDEPFSLNNKDGSLRITWMKINDRQTVELFTVSDKTPKNGDSLYHIALETDDAQGMLKYLIAKGVKGPGGKPLAPVAKPGQIGNYGYFCEDPDGHIVEIVQYLPTGWTKQHAGQALPSSRIAARISHAGVSVGNLNASLKFYHDILGCNEFWRGSRDGKMLSWVNVRLPESNDYLELMLYDKQPTVAALHTMNHLCLEVPSVAKSEAILKSRTLPESCKPMTPLKAGVNRKKQVNCFDPDGTRVEIMDDHTVDGKPTPSSTAPAPGGSA
jgi:catechol 2,3-dioxygenase-like lactoylglutathione lyase family enzyme